MMITEGLVLFKSISLENKIVSLFHVGGIAFASPSSGLGLGNSFVLFL